VRIGVVIPAFNVAPWLAQAIQSVVEQTYGNWRLVIVDDGSTDDTGGVIARFTDRRITALHQPNQGVSTARNRGITAAADADALLFLDGDDWLAPEALQLLATTLDDAPSAIAAAAGYTRVAGDGSGRHVRVTATGDIFRHLLTRNLFINGGHLLIRRSAIAAVGPFNAALRYGEDWHYWVRLAARGPFVTVPGSPGVLFLRERAGSAYHTMAWDQGVLRPCLDAIYADGAVRARLPPLVLERLRHAAEAENDWVVGRELIRHGRSGEGRRALLCSLRAAPSLKRLALFCASWTGKGPFHPYAASASTSRRDTALTGIAA